MLLIKFAICIYAIIVITMTTGCSLIGSHSGKDTNAASETPGNDKTGTIAGTVETADLSGAPVNAFEIFNYTGVEGEWRRNSATFQIPVEGPGTFVILSSGIESRSCSPDQFHATFALFEVNNDGTLANMRPLEPQLPLTFYEKKLLHLQVDATVKAHCTSIGPAKFFVAMKFISQRSGDDATDPGQVPGQPDPANQPGQPHPKPPLPRPVPRVSCKDVTLPANAPDIFQAKIRLWTATSQSEGCKNTFTWLVRDAVRPDPYADCAFPEVTVARPQDQFLKLSESFPSHKLQLAWLLLQSNGDAEAVKDQLLKGKTVDLTYDNDPCLTANDAAVPQTFTNLTLPTDYLLFRNDSRERDEQSGTQACPHVVFHALELVGKADGRKDVQVTYKYTDNNISDFFYAIDFNLVKPSEAAGSWKSAFFDRKSHAWVTTWEDAPADRVFNNKVKVTDAGRLKHLLPNQEHLELVFRQVNSCNDDTALTQAIFDVGALFTSSGADDYFDDLTNPERSRFLLRETDLPQ